ncbi:DNA recombination protein RmuC [Pseudoxanthobacter sp. M-2]|uniref:DNA recombination protein RmuC n=1 Tax=Pseudoxanthobacter sp. M-2 TaxID=3078754 RepID=UPI0038FC43BD
MFEGPLAEPLFMLGSRAVLVGEVALAAAVVLGVLLVVTLMALRKAARAGLEAELIAAERTEVLEDRIGELLRVQSETSGRLQTMAEVLGSRQSDLARLVGERLDGLGHRLGQSMAETTKSTHANLTQLNERLAVIDRAQDTIAKLSGHVVALEKIFADKQTRGAFGQGRMEAIVRDALPTGAYEFQATLSNGTRPDCLVRLSNGQPPLAIDAKFPLEAYNRIRAADRPELAKAAETQFRRDLGKHVDDISARYLIPGETQDTAFLFVPSESVFAEIHERFEDIIARAGAARVVIVSPSLLVLSVQVVQAILRDERMREQAHIVQAEVRRLVEDVVRLHERTLALQKHIAQAGGDLDLIVVSADKIRRRGGRLEALDLDEPAGEPLGSANPSDDGRRAAS